MKTPLLRFCILLCVLLVSAVTQAQEVAEPVATPVAASSKVEAELKSLVEKINTKLAAGVHSEEALAEDLKSFDAILAAHKGEQTEEVARVLVMKATLYIEVLQNFDKAEETFKQIKRDFPNTQIAQKVDDALAELAQQKEKQKIQAALQPGVIFPDFDEKDLVGKPLSIGKFKGKIVLVDFWATWCGPCMAELPNVLAAYKKYHDKGLEVIGINLDQDEATLKRFIADKVVPWPQYFDGKGWESKLCQKYGISGIPATFLIDRDGKIIAKELFGPELEAELEKQLGK